MIASYELKVLREIEIIVIRTAGLELFIKIAT